MIFFSFSFQASANEILWVIRISIFIVGALATMVGLLVPSIYELFHLCSDLVFVILFPQLVGAVHIPFVNTYGSICAYIIGLFLRITGGEELIGLPALIKYPFYKNGVQYFPFRLLSMIISFLTLLLVSYLTNYLLDNDIVSRDWDLLNTIERRDINNSATRKSDGVMLTDYSGKQDETSAGVVTVGDDNSEDNKLIA